jgi:hypothetical protein
VAEAFRLYGVRDVAVGAGAVWAVGEGRRRAGRPPVLFRIDPDDGEVVARFVLDPRPGRSRATVQRVAAGPSGVWVALRYGRRAGDILRIDPCTGEIAARIDARGAPGDIALAGDAIWFLSNARRGLGSVSLHRIDPSTDEIVATPVRERLHHVGGSEMLPSFAVGDDDVWVSSFEDGRQHALRIDTHTNDVTVEPLALKHFSPVAVTAGGVWFIGRGGLARLDIDALDASRPLELPMAPTDASFDPASGNLWLAGYHAEIVRVEERDCAVGSDGWEPGISRQKPPIVLACGRTTEGRPVELFTFRDAGGPCLSIAGLPGGTRACGRVPSERVPQVRAGIGGPVIVQRSPGAPIELYGETGGEAQRVTIRYRTSADGPVRQRRAALLRARDDESLEAAGIRRPFGYFIGSVPPTAQDIVATARTRSGDVIDRADFDPIVDSMPPRAFIVRRQAPGHVSPD